MKYYAYGIWNIHFHSTSILEKANSTNPIYNKIIFFILLFFFSRERNFFTERKRENRFFHQKFLRFHFGFFEKIIFHIFFEAISLLLFYIFASFSFFSLITILKIFYSMYHTFEACASTSIVVFVKIIC